MDIMKKVGQKKWQTSAVKAPGPGLFFVGRLFISFAVCPHWAERVSSLVSLYEDTKPIRSGPWPYDLI